MYFLSELRKAFQNVLNLKDEDIIFPEDAQLYIAIGASILSQEEEAIRFNDLLNRFRNKYNNINTNGNKN